jgi:hypothetical protein
MGYHLPQQYQTIHELDLRDAACPYYLQHKEDFHLMTRTWEKHYRHPKKQNINARLSRK